MSSDQESGHWVLEERESGMIVLRHSSRSTGWAFESWDDLREMAEYILVSTPSEKK